MKEFFAGLAILAAAVVVVCGLSWLLTGNSLLLKGYFAPKSMAIDSKVFHESQQFNDAMMRDLDDAREIYADPKTTDDQKVAIKATLSHRFAGYDTSKLSADQRDFLTSIRGY